MNNGLKLSGGLFKSNTDITMKSTITAPTTVGNTYYTSGTIDGKVEFARDVSPMIAVGYDYNLGSNWTLGAELGAILNDGFKATATATGPITQADLYAEMKDLQDALSSTKIALYQRYGNLSVLMQKCVIPCYFRVSRHSYFPTISCHFLALRSR